MCILGAVFIDHVVVERLTDFIWIGGDPYNDEELKSVTRILASLGTGIAELKEFYNNSKHDPPQDPQRFFPFIRHYSVGEHVLRFSYRDYLMPKTPEGPSRAIFQAIETESRREIVVKFVQRYNAEAHRLLASADRAPERVLLIDFDWCGVHEEHTYPVSLNDARDMTNSINWHPDVKRGGRMMKEHDSFMLKRMKLQS